MREIDYDTYLKEMQKRIRAAYREKGKRRSNQISPGEELRAIVARHRRAIKDVPADLKLWLALFDEASAFWLAVWATYREQIKGPSDERFICLTALGGRVLQDMFCVRDLVAGGFFVQSNVVTRSLIEAIDVMHLINGRPELAETFIQTKQNDSASDFWHKHCSRGKIGKLVKDRWLWFVDADEDVATAFHGLRENYVDLVGMSAHPSFGASFATFMDSLKEESNIAENAMGAVSR